MQYRVLAADYDGTLAQDGAVDKPTVDALERLKASGRLLVLVTGRRLEELLDVFPQLNLFESAVVENGAVLYSPATAADRRLADAPHPAFAELLRRSGVTPLVEGRVIVATTDEHRDTVLAAIEELGLELQLIFNKGAVMVLPPGVNKASGLLTALGEMGVSPENVVGVGDAENDHSFLAACGCSVAVHNALGALMEKAHLVTRSDAGEGVIELIDALLEDDLAGALERGALGGG